MPVLVAVVLVVAGCAAAATRLRVAAPVLLVVVGALAGLVPGVPLVEVEPDWVLLGVLPPLLYSAAVAMPATSFRRELRTISGLSVTLVVVSSLLLGLFFSAALGLDLGWAVALGAIVSPTDAVATAIARRAGVPARVLTLLEGESLLNDATALVLLRSAVAGAGAAVSVGAVALDFVLAVAFAVVIGVVVGRTMLAVRARVADPTVTTLLSFTVPFLAALPAEAVDASGLVAAVVAGLVTGHRAPRVLTPRDRVSDALSWRTVELALEGAVFLVMGLQLEALVVDVRAQHGSLHLVLGVAAVGLALTVAVRAAYVVLLLRSARRRVRHSAERSAWLDEVEQRVERRVQHLPADGDTRAVRRVERFRARVRQARHDLDYVLDERLGPREGVVIVWAGMRGAISLAAAQTLPASTPDRPVLVLVAFTLAGGSLLLQGLTLPALARRLARPATADDRASRTRARMHALLDEVAAREGQDAPRVQVLRAQRTALLDALEEGALDPDAVGHALDVLDAEESGLELRGEGLRTS
ncbi:MAG: cation:proton antiporter [Nocardioides sp.]|nr:cation:proton antiporter [Nocardioides sp.]